MNATSLPVNLLAAGKTPPATERSPLLYAWFAFQILLALALVYGVVRLVRRRSHRRRSS